MDHLDCFVACAPRNDNSVILLDPIITTVAHRPYVFLFLIAFLVMGFKTKGPRFTLIFLVTGYFIAWASEALSIRTGFPYGWYFYIYENLKGELLLAGVPVWDSLSYTFLCFAGLMMAEFCDSRRFHSAVILRHGPKDLPSNHGGFFALLRMTTLAALFVTLLDIVIDPLANLGDKWFLGKIYYYPDPGFYFGVPLSNFAGWFLVSLVIVGLNLWLYHGSTSSPCPEKDTLSLSKGRRLLKIAGPLFYFSLFAFNWGLTLWIKEWTLALFDLALISLFWFFCLRRKNVRPGMMTSGWLVRF